MTAIKRIRKYLEAHPTSAQAEILSRLVLALEAEERFPLGDLYELDYDVFTLAIDLLKDWRLDRYYVSKGRLLDLTMQITELHAKR